MVNVKLKLILKPTCPVSIVYTPPPPILLGEGEGWTSYQILKRGGGWQDLNFERGFVGKEGDNFWLRIQFLLKDKMGLTTLQIIFKTSRSGWSEKLKSLRSYQIIGSQIKIFDY